MATRHRDGSVLIGAPSEQVFAYVDDHEQFASHMNESSWMMGGGRMVTELDGRRGKAVGSHIRMSGTVFGMRLFLDEVVTLRTPPIEKAWETVGIPRLLVIGPYEMGFHVRPEAGGTRLYVFIDYDLPQKWFGKVLGWMFGGFYARWCVRQMLNGAARRFAAPGRRLAA